MINPYTSARFANLLAQPGGVLLEQSDTGKMAALEPCGLTILCSTDPVEAEKWLCFHEEKRNHYPLIALCGSEAIQAFGSYAPGRVLENCHEYIWTEKPAPEISGKLRFRPSMKEDYEWVRERYALISDQELKAIVDSGHLLLAFEEEEPVGFAGIHVEGLMGLLEIFPEYRQKGYGKELESRLIGFVLEQGLIPVCDIFPDNTLSDHLQQSLGLRKGEEAFAYSRTES